MQEKKFQFKSSVHVQIPSERRSLLSKPRLFPKNHMTACRPW